MALRPLNSVGGFSVGETPVTIIAANGDITTANLTSNGAVAFTGSNVSLGAVSNLHITGGTNGQFLATDGGGNLAWTTVSTSGLSNGNSNIVVAANGNITMSASGTANVLKVAPAGVFVTDLYADFIEVDNANVQGNLRVTGNLSANSTTSTSIYGKIRSNQQEYITVVGALEGLYVDGGTTITGNLSLTDATKRVTIAGNLSAGNANLGNTATANFFVGNGSLLTGTIGNANYAFYANLSDHANTAFQVDGANVTGAVANANYATHAGTAYSVDGANVSGTVANATYALSANSAAYANVAFYIDGANVNGTVANATFATSAGTANVAYSVDGANVVGEVANAAYATAAGSATVANSANSVAGANVSGEVANAAYATNAGTASTANSVAGANVTGTVANATHAANADFATTAATAYSVDGANVSGTVGNAVFATSAGTANVAYSVDGANVVGTVSDATNANYANFAGTAYSVDGANVSGSVANATYANTAGSASQANTANVAYSVAGANVSGEVANANYASFANSATFASNVNASGIVGTVANANYATFAGEVTTNAQPNITSVGVLSFVSVNGTANVYDLEVRNNAYMNVTFANTSSVQNQLDAGSLSTSNLNAATGNLYISAPDQIVLSAGNLVIDAGNARITMLAEPNAATDAATKGYVDSVAQGLHIKSAVAAATPATLATITGGTVTYNNGTAGLGATLTTTGTFTNIDTVAINSVGTRILVKSEANAAHNGIYVYTSSTVITRSTDEDTTADMQAGDFVFVNGGATYADTGWVLVDPVTTVGTSPVNFTQFSGAGTYTAGNGIALNGGVFSANVDGVTTAIIGGNIVVKSSAQLTTPNIGAATGTSIDLTGNANVGNISATNATLTGTIGVTGNANIAGNLDAGNITTAAISATGNVSGGNLVTTGAVAATGDVSGGTVTATGNVSGGNLTTAGAISGGSLTLTTGNATVGNIAVSSLANVDSLRVNGVANLGAVGNVKVTGGTSGQVLSTDGAGNLSFVTVSSSSLTNGNSNVTVNANGNVTISAGGTANALVVQTDGVSNIYALKVATYAQITGSTILGGNVTANSNVNVNWNVTAANVFANAGNVQGNNVISRNEVWVESGLTKMAAATLTTTSTTSNQTIVSIPNDFDVIVGIEFFVKGQDGNAKYSSQTVSCVSSNTAVDYSIYGTNYLGSSPGSLSVVAVGNAIELRVTPSSSNSTIWTASYKYI